MESNKLEKDFKDKLEQRTLQPTETAWDRLDAMLSVAEGKKKKPNRAWMYMAASFFALLLVGTLFLNQEKSDTHHGTTNTNSVVATSQPETTTGTSVDNVNTDVVKAQDGVATATIDTPVKPNVKNTVVTVYTTKAAIRNIRNNTVTATTVPIDKNTIITEPIATQAVAENTTNKAEAHAVKPQIQSVKVDANALLASVEKTSVTILSANNTATASNGKRPGVKVNANSLLSSVEGELDESFRGKVLQTVAKNYNIVKTSVASRNRQ